MARKFSILDGYLTLVGWGDRHPFVEYFCKPFAALKLKPL
jgi:hypothetical protein